MKIRICTPTLDGLSVEYVTSLHKTSAQLMAQGHCVTLNIIRGCQFIAQVRNKMATVFLEQSDDDVLFFIDADQGWDADAFERMALGEKEFTAGAVPKKDDTLNFNNADLVTDEKNMALIDNGMMQARMVGTGFMCLKRSVFEKMAQHYPTRYNPGDRTKNDTFYNFFETRIEDGIFWGEDLTFCKKWVAIDGKIWIDTNIDFSHLGMKSWKGNFLKYLMDVCNVETEER